MNQHVPTTAWMQTHTGRKFYPMEPFTTAIHIEDIAHALSNQCRYAGHCRDFYSVAQHSVLVSRALPDEHKFWGLLHDASEAYIVDIPRPLKQYIPEYLEIERNVMAAICRTFSLPREMPAEVKRVDNAILADEANQLMNLPPHDWFFPEPYHHHHSDLWVSCILPRVLESWVSTGVVELQKVSQGLGVDAFIGIDFRVCWLSRRCEQAFCARGARHSRGVTDRLSRAAERVAKRR